MTLILKNADIKGVHGGNYPHSLSANQIDLVDILTKLWNNQDRFSKDDLKHLEYLTKK